METLDLVGSETAPALHRLPHGAPRPVADALVVEGALQIGLNGAPYSVTMRTPGDDALLALGLLFAEGVIGGADDVLRCEERPSASEGEPDRVELFLRPAALAGKTLAARRLDSTSSCGVCGKVDAGDLAAVVARPVGDAPAARLELDDIPALEGRMRAAQALFNRTGGSHAAAVFDGAGNLLVLKEDVGRHNAVDKAVGHLLRAGRLAEGLLLFISGRVSYEIVAKASKAGFAFLLAVSAPSTLAVKLCREAGITLIGFCRAGKATVYSHAGRVTAGGGDMEVTAWGDLS